MKWSIKELFFEPILLGIFICECEISKIQIVAQGDFYLDQNNVMYFYHWTWQYVDNATITVEQAATTAFEKYVKLMKEAETLSNV